MNPGLAVRPYADRDFDDLVRRWHETNLVSYPYVEEQRRHTLEDAREFFRAKVLSSCTVWVAEQSGSLLGLLALEAPWIRQFAVFPEHQRQGVGTALLRQARVCSPPSCVCSHFSATTKLARSMKSTASPSWRSE